MADYPEQCLKGLAGDDCITSEGLVSAAAFQFKVADRADSWQESSINWRDSEASLQHTLQQRRSDGSLQFKRGVAVLNRNDLDVAMQRYRHKGLLGYERRPIENNPHHGNLLLAATATQPARRLICAALAHHAQEVIPPPP